MIRLRRSCASLHSGCAQHDIVLGGTNDGSHYFLNRSNISVHAVRDHRCDVLQQVIDIQFAVQ